MTDRLPPTSNTASRSRRERGTLLFLVIIVLVPLAALAGSLLSVGARQLQEEDAVRGRARALLLAESGLDHGLSRLLQDPTDLEPLESFAEDGSLRYRVEFTPLGADDIDNDDDGSTDEADEAKLVRLESIGLQNVVAVANDGTLLGNGGQQYSKRVRAVGRRGDGLPGFPYAVYLGDPNAELQLNGNAFFIDGNDYDTDLALTGSPAVPGIATTGAPADIVDQMSNQQMDNVDGQDGSPSVHNTSPLDLQAIIDEYKSAATIKFVNPDSTYTGNLGDPETDDYVVTYCLGNLKISGGGEGAGLLLVEGNLEVTGAWDYKGIVIVTGQVVFRGGGGTKRVVGTVLVGGDVIAGTNQDEDLEISGTVDILYSSEIQEEVSAGVAKFTLFGWQEL